jgi:hypothetical protein
MQSGSRSHGTSADWPLRERDMRFWLAGAIGILVPTLAAAPYEAERLIPFISNDPLIWWLYPAFGLRGRVPRRHRFGRHLYHEGHDHSVHVGRLGSGCGISGEDRQCPIPDDGSCSACRVDLPAEAGCRGPRPALLRRPPNPGARPKWALDWPDTRNRWAVGVKGLI